MTEIEACCTCAALLNPAATSTTSAPSYELSLETEKPVLSSSLTSPPRRLPCCNRSICSTCLTSNPRFQTYCPFCQVSTEPSPLPQGLRDPPAYTEPEDDRTKAVDTKDGLRNGAEAEFPPPYTTAQVNGNGVATDAQGEDVIHHLHADDTIPGLSLAYRVPALVLRTHNGLYSESLLHARKTVLIPRSHYNGPSLSADPVESEEESERKAAIRRFMVSSKCHEYEMAELYLKQAEGDVDRALERWADDERWEKDNPYKRGDSKGKAKDDVRRRMNNVGGSLMRQLR